MLINKIKGVYNSNYSIEKYYYNKEKLLDNGYNRGIDTPIEKHRKRAYYYDKAGFEWELVEYLSEKTNEKYLYE